MSPEIRALFDKAQASCNAARVLQREGFMDFAASRAYYAMFYTAEALLLSRGFSFSSHSAVIAAFGKEFAKSGDLDSRFHRHLIDAQDTRITGDYRTGVTITSVQVDEALRWAQDFLAAASAFLARKS
ncbi:MAG: HEPN domain-containing protein [Anaerolineales bacterium]